ncbi:MAG: XRE family transcriptional regulator [Sphingomonas hengshuiensis]|nr:MAG: XRE family transcriptional regulator [Sphingomonas hengshuiensis]
MSIRETFAKNLRAVRARKKVSQEELAHRAGVDRTYISSLERCIYSPTIDVLQQIADVLEVSAADLLVGHTPRTDSNPDAKKARPKPRQ